uniref:EGF-like domain-containing protein n=1 Tax=Panagrellus redivivus TaxID=6233 RepID=A0A7E4W7N4_PANRE
MFQTLALVCIVGILPVYAQTYGGQIVETDQIETVDVTPTQIIITTSKAGPVEDLAVFIDVIDIEHGVHVPPMNLSGLLLLITRGRYTINFLRPSTWYGVVFQSQHSNSNLHSPINYEEKLVRTLAAPDMPAGDEEEALHHPPINVSTSRLSEKGKSIENLLLSIRWVLPKEYRKNLQAVANVSLHCSEHTRYKELRLSDEETQKTVEVKLDNKFDIQEHKNGSREIVASIQPRNCHRICWETKLTAPFDHYHFEHDIMKDCSPIETVTTKTNLRDYLSYDVKHGDLVVHTNFSDPGNVEEAIVEIQAVELPTGIKTINNKTRRLEVFPTEHHDNEFVVHNLDPAKWYAVQYTYKKKSPFIYSESRRFIVESMASTSKPPFRLRFLTSDPHNGTTNSTAAPQKPLRPRILAVLDPSYTDFRVGIDVEPFCDAKGPKAGEHFWLTAQNPQHELSGLDLLRAICSEKPSHALCGDRDETVHDVPGIVTNFTKCSSPTLCYAGNLVVSEKIYAMKKRCVNVANYFPILEAAVTHNSAASTITITIIILLNIFV